MSGEVNFVEFRSDDDDESAALRLSFERSSWDPDLAAFEVRVDAGGLTCDHAATTWNGDGLDRFFADLDRDWRGWEGVRNWEALEHELSIEATHRGRVVELLFILRRDYKPDAWEIRLPVVIAPGESLTRIAFATAAMLRAAQ